MEVNDIVQWELEAAAKVPFTKVDKNGTQLSVGYETWLALEHLEKVASTLFADFKSMWKWVKKVSPHLEEFKTAYHTMVNLLFILKYNLQDELNRWKTELKADNKSYFYNLPKSVANWY